MNPAKENISGKVLSDKIGQLLSDQQLKISVDQFQELCNQPSVQPFLKWFCQHVSQDNILSKKEIQMSKSLKKNNKWLTGDKLDIALATALKDHPELESKVEENVNNYEAELYKACEAEKEAYTEDLKYQTSLNNSLKRFKELELKQDEELEREKIKLENLEIENLKVYNDCLLITEEYDLALKDLDIFLKQTLNAYRDVTKKRSRIICWNQVPLDIYVKQIDTYNKYLESYIEKNSSIFKKYFPDNFLPVNDETESSNEETNIGSFMDTELKSSEIRLTNALSKKIDCEVNRYTGEAAIKRAIEIYNDGDIDLPKTHSQLMSETVDLTAKRDSLLQNNLVLEQELKNCIVTYSQLSVSQVLVDMQEFRLQQKKNELKQLQDILYIARDMGHAHSDLLSMLMQSQLRKLTNLRKIIPEAQRYLRTIYQQSSKRHQHLQHLQAQYNIVDKSSSCEENIYKKLFSQLVSGDKNSKDSFESSVKQYNGIIAENISLKEDLLENSYNNQLQYLKTLEKQVMIMYDNELNSGQTKSFKLMSNELTAQFEHVIESIEKNQNDFSRMRKKFKNFLEKITQNFSDHEKEILWQKFLADPEGLKRRYDEIQNELNRAHFGNSALSEQ
ncbi:HAUS augmin-like complex subunit 3 [Cotesia glomerata]|uniref:HAUS augmin-like complex subunit 3 N-terminal domain-containing protein n=1 Tax=Cotesia glomerata TaxID=32391 RepID=A0AAV7HH52_COTGL|nr:HAUS augmin-like complex subunit 3 [Cotesia glomerata]XP_044576510.1 HAUS augmin-like complex subunit 3 [Cotesia glomerata]XP_044576511.1 HAUS augmin-like complex subunit 3 [Cotesia glomerata]KAH0539175.1 hypothetical protein KQX54_001621 [Cotesia glomerata]